MSQIFYDQNKIRWKYARIFLIFGPLFVFLFFLIAIASIVIKPEIPAINLPEQPIGFSTLLSNEGNSDLDILDDTNNEKKSKIIAYFVNWDDKSFASLEKNARKIDILIPEWLHLKDNQGSIYENDPGIRKKVMDYLNANKLPVEVQPLINNYNQETKTWDRLRLMEVLTDKNRRIKLIRNLASYIQENKLSGISIDFENLLEADQIYLQLLMS